MRPRVRRQGLLIRELPDELLVYDREEHRAHCLNRTAAIVFRHADGTRSLADLARLLDPGAGTAAEEVVVVALGRLAEAGLLESEVGATTPEADLTRRDLVRRASLATAILLPTVASVLAPTPAEAAATCVTSCAGQPNGTRCDVCFAGASCATTTDTCAGGACTDGCPNP
jgi:hypothetical protein